VAEGRFISFEGGEGAGKSTQARKLAERLEGQGISVTLTREPGGATSAEAIRELLVHGDTGRWEPMSEALLHIAARVEHLAKTVRPALEAGRWIISDRYVDSTRIYQGIVQGVGIERIDELHALALDGVMPDRTLILDLPVEEGLARAAARVGEGEDRYERMGRPFHESLRAGYRQLARSEPERCRLIDASADTETVAERIWSEITPLLEVV